MGYSLTRFLPGRTFNTDKRFNKFALAGITGAFIYTSPRSFIKHMLIGERIVFVAIKPVCALIITAGKISGKTRQAFSRKTDRRFIRAIIMFPRPDISDDNADAGCVRRNSSAQRNRVIDIGMRKTHLSQEPVLTGSIFKPARHLFITINADDIGSSQAKRCGSKNAGTCPHINNRSAVYIFAIRSHNCQHRYIMISIDIGTGRIR